MNWILQVLTGSTSVCGRKVVLKHDGACEENYLSSNTFHLCLSLLKAVWHLLQRRLVNKKVLSAGLQFWKICLTLVLCREDQKWRQLEVHILPRKYILSFYSVNALSDPLCLPMLLARSLPSEFQKRCNTTWSWFARGQVYLILYHEIFYIFCAWIVVMVTDMFHLFDLLCYCLPWYIQHLA